MARAKKEKATKRVTLAREKIRARRLLAAKLKKENREKLAGRYFNYAAGLAQNFPYNLKPSTRGIRDKINLGVSRIYMAEFCLQNTYAGLHPKVRESLYELLQPLLEKMRENARENPYSNVIPISEREDRLAKKIGLASIARIEATLQRHSAILGLDKMDRVEMGVKEHTLVHGFDMAERIIGRMKKSQG